MAVAGGPRRAGRRATPTCDHVVLVTRDLPLLEGGNGAALVAGLGLPADDRRWSSRSAVDRRCSTRCSPPTPGTLVIGADAGAGVARRRGGGRATVTALALDAGRRGCCAACRCGPAAATARCTTTTTRGCVRERGMRVGAHRRGHRAARPSPRSGSRRKDAAALCEGDAPRVLDHRRERAAVRARRAGRDARERAAARVRAGDDDRGRASTAGDRRVARVERRRAGPAAEAARHAGPGDPDLARRPTSGRSTPRCGWRPGGARTAARWRCRRATAAWAAAPRATPSSPRCPRDATVYTTTTIHTPVPGLATPYTIVIVELGDTGVRLLAQVTGAPPGTVGIGDRGDDGAAPGRRAIRAFPTTATRSAPSRRERRSPR